MVRSSLKALSAAAREIGSSWSACMAKAGSMACLIHALFGTSADLAASAPA